MEITTAKQVAQSFYLDDIVTHDLILDAYNLLERDLREHQITWEKSDIIYKLSNSVLGHKLADVFDIKKSNVLKIIHEEYNSEIEYLYLINQKK